MIRLDNISKTFRDGDTQVQALKNISFEVNKGELVAIIGKSGSGKSTLLNILGLLDKQTDGDYYIDGKKVSSIPEREKAKLRNSHIGFVMQDFALVEKYTVKQNINFPLIYTDKPINKEKAINDVLKSRFDFIFLHIEKSSFALILSSCYLFENLDDTLIELLDISKSDLTYLVEHQIIIQTENGYHFIHDIIRKYYEQYGAHDYIAYEELLLQINFNIMKMYLNYISSVY